MKPNVTSKPSFSAAEAKAALIAAPDFVEDADCPYDPNDAASVEAFWEKHGEKTRSVAELREKLAKRRRRGPNKTPTKTRVTLRLSPDVAASFKATGKGWQTRMDNALREWLKTHSA
jgi:uncharacterized protein (DUF4415 family)